MLKYIGIFILSLSVSAYGAVLSKQMKDTHELRSEITTLLRNIEHGIKYGSKPLSDILAECNLQRLGKSGFIYSLISEQNIKEAIDASLNGLTKEEKHKLYNFFTSIGKSTNSERELVLCRSYIEDFEAFEKKSLQEISTKATLYKKIGIICGIMAAIIFI